MTQLGEKCGNTRPPERLSYRSFANFFQEALRQSSNSNYFEEVNDPPPFPHDFRTSHQHLRNDYD